MQGVNKIGEKAGESKCALVFGQMNEPPGARARVALTGLTIAEYFRDIEGQDVLFFVDNIFRFTQVCGTNTVCLHQRQTVVRLAHCVRDCISLSCNMRWKSDLNPDLLLLH